RLRIRCRAPSYRARCGRGARRPVRGRGGGPAAGTGHSRQPCLRRRTDSPLGTSLSPSASCKLSSVKQGPIATFTTIEQSTAEDWAIIAADFMNYARQLPKRLVEHLKLLDGDFGGFPVDRLHHSLLTATLAMKDGRDDEYVACALLHDIGDTLGTFNHPDIAAAILKPFVSEENHWMVEKHGIFQGYYFFHHIGMDRHMRDQFRDHACFQR